MLNALIIGNLHATTRQPAIAVPTTAASGTALLDQIRHARQVGADACEIRLDYLWPSSIITPKILSQWQEKIRVIHPRFPLIWTYRTVAEGGQGTLTPDHYVDLQHTLSCVLRDDHASAIDSEYLTWSEQERTEYSAFLSHAPCPVITSVHYWHSTPSIPHLDALSSEIARQGETILKIATSACTPADVDTFTRWVQEYYRACHSPLIAIIMGDRGTIFRVNPHRLHSVLTFATASSDSGGTAPGQPTVADIRQAWTTHHDRNMDHE